MANIILPVPNNNQQEVVGSRIVLSSYTKRTDSSCLHRKVTVGRPSGKYNNYFIITFTLERNHKIDNCSGKVRNDNPSICNVHILYLKQ